MLTRHFPVPSATPAIGAAPAAARLPGTGTGRAPGTCGELVQGRIGDRDVMITFPIGRYSTVRVTPSADPGVTVWPPDREKARQAAELMLGPGRRPDSPGLSITVASEIGVAKGYASSSADIVATCRAVADFLDEPPPSAADLAHTACAIEPSDGVMVPNPVAFDFIRGAILCDPARPAPVTAVAVDPGGTVETASFRRIPYTRDERARLREAYDLVLHGLRTGNPAAVGAGATISARVNQWRHHKPQLERLVAMCAALGGCGVAVAHSGVVAAMLFDSRDPDRVARAVGTAARRLPRASVVRLDAAEPSDARSTAR